MQLHPATQVAIYNLSITSDGAILCCLPMLAASHDPDPGHHSVHIAMLRSCTGQSCRTPQTRRLQHMPATAASPKPADSEALS